MPLLGLTAHVMARQPHRLWRVLQRHLQLRSLTTPHLFLLIVTVFTAIRSSILFLQFVLSIVPFITT